MSVLDQVKTAIAPLASKQKESVQLQLSYLRSGASRNSETLSTLGADTKNHLQTVIKADSFTSAYQMQRAFEDSVRATIGTAFKGNMDANKALFEDMRNLFTAKAAA